MTQQDILDFMNKNQVCTLATCEGNKPYVRGIKIYRADRDGIVFHTGIAKDMFEQLKKNPNVEFCFITETMQVRTSGPAVLENDRKLKEEMIAMRPFLKPMVERDGFDSLAVYRVRNMVSTVWTMATNADKKEYIEIK